MLRLDSERLSVTFSVVSPVLPRPALDILPAPPGRSVPQRGWPRWAKTGSMGRSLPRPKNPRLWGLGIGSVALGLVNGALVISAGVGLVAYQQLLQLSPRQRKGLMQRVQQGLPLPATPQQQALVLGLVAGASTYTFTALWHSTHSLLMALLLTGQGALALFAVGALVRSSRSPDLSDDLWNAAPVAQVEHNLTLLSHPDPLKRLVAVRRLVRLAQVDEEYLAGMSLRSHLIDCFQLRLSQETESIVRSALDEGLLLLRKAPSLAPSSATPFTAESPTQAVLKEADLELEPAAPVPEPDSLGPQASAPTPAPQGRRTVEYVEYLDI